MSSLTLRCVSAPTTPFPSRPEVTMASSWLAREVLRELELAGAPYFALTLRSAPWSSHMVCYGFWESRCPLCAP